MKGASEAANTPEKRLSIKEDIKEIKEELENGKLGCKSEIILRKMMEKEESGENGNNGRTV